MPPCAMSFLDAAVNDVNALRGQLPLHEKCGLHGLTLSTFHHRFNRSLRSKLFTTQFVKVMPSFLYNDYCYNPKSSLLIVLFLIFDCSLVKFSSFEATTAAHYHPFREEIGHNSNFCGFLKTLHPLLMFIDVLKL